MTIKSGMALHIYNHITGYVDAGDHQDSLDPPPNLSGQLQAKKMLLNENNLDKPQSTDLERIPKYLTVFLWGSWVCGYVALDICMCFWCFFLGSISSDFFLFLFALSFLLYYDSLGTCLFSNWR